MISIEQINQVVDQEFKRICPTKTQDSSIWIVMFNGRLWKTYKGKFSWSKPNHAKLALNNTIEIGLTVAKNFNGEYYSGDLVEDAKEIRKHLEKTGIIKYVKLETEVKS